MSSHPPALLVFLLACAGFVLADESPLPEEKPDTWPAAEDETTPPADRTGTPADEARAAGLAPTLSPEPGRVAHPPMTEEHIKQLLRNLESKSLTERQYARQVLDSLPPDALQKPLVQALYSKSPKLRQYAAESLSHVRDDAVLRPLIARAVEDEVEDVRHAAVDSLVTLAGQDVAWSFLREMNGWVPRWRTNAFQALAWIGNPYAIGPLIRHTRYRAYGGGGPRAHIFVGEQFSYVKDYDVEIATNAVAYDPIIGVVNNGIVLDVQVVRTEQVVDVYERIAAFDALRALTGQNFREDYAAWNRWWDANRAHLTAEYEKADAERRGSDRAEWLFSTAGKLEQAERFEDAIKKYRTLLASHPGSAFDARARESLAALEASPTVRQRIELARREAECKRLISLAETYLANGMSGKAVEPARTIAEKYPDTEWATRARELLEKAQRK